VPQVREAMHGDSGEGSSKVMVDLPPPFADDRGSIQMLIDFPIGSVMVIASKKGSLRGNHYHKEDEHYSYLGSGRMEYYQRPAGSSSPPSMLIIEPGQMFYSPAMVEHAMYFLEDSVLYVFAKLNRDQVNYEADVVRVKVA